MGGLPEDSRRDLGRRRRPCCRRESFERAGLRSPRPSSCIRAVAAAGARSCGHLPSARWRTQRGARQAPAAGRAPRMGVLPCDPAGGRRGPDHGHAAGEGGGRASDKRRRHHVRRERCLSPRRVGAGLARALSTDRPRGHLRDDRGLVHAPRAARALRRVADLRAGRQRLGGCCCGDRDPALLGATTALATRGDRWSSRLWLASSSSRRCSRRRGLSPRCSSPAGSATRPAPSSTHHKPDPFPAVFGFHELFHALVILAVALQYTVVATFILPT